MNQVWLHCCTRKPPTQKQAFLSLDYSLTSSNCRPEASIFHVVEEARHRLCVGLKDHSEAATRSFRQLPSLLRHPRMVRYASQSELSYVSCLSVNQLRSLSASSAAPCSPSLSCSLLSTTKATSPACPRPLYPLRLFTI